VWKYRPEIDGLRAIAILLVLLFHADLGFKGGFIGVDVFFVISGYLITGIILNKQRAGQFRITEFWERRVRRILPASILMVTAVLCYASFTLMPEDFSQLSKTALYHQCLFSNVNLWLTVGYFNDFAELNPLLHTWSLAVEEQFYLIYPFLLMWLGRYRESVRLRVLTVLFLLSFIGSEYAVHTKPELSFFLLPTRAWEMLLGGIICFLPASNRDHYRVREVISTVSVLGLVFCGWYYHEELPFPGLYAALPCFLTAGFICSNLRNQTAIGRVMSSKPIVFVGLISYSLYLAHWPILAFLKYQYGQELLITTKLVAIVASVLMAIISWRWIERPFRRRVILPKPRHVLLATFVAPALLISVSVVIHKNHGFPNRIPKVARDYLATKTSRTGRNYRSRLSPEQIQADEVPVCGDPDGGQEILVWGDSHALALMPAIDAACQKLNIKCYQITYPGNTPLLDYGVGMKRHITHRSIERNRAAYEFLVRNEIPLVVLAAYWGSSYRSHSEIFEKSVRDTIDQLEQAGVQVVIVEDNATFRYRVPQRLARLAWLGQETSEIGISLEEHYEYNRVPREVFQSLSNKNVRVYDPTSYFAGDSNLWSAEIDGVSMMRDTNHLSEAGAMRLKPLIERAVLESLPQIAAEPEKQYH